MIHGCDYFLQVKVDSQVHPVLRILWKVRQIYLILYKNS